MGYLHNTQNYLLKNSGNLSSNSFKLKECWNLLKYELGKKGINKIKIYLNMICQKVKELIRKKKMFWNTIYNWKFIKNYNSYYDNYMKLNYLIQEIKSIITESINISENDYPFI